MNKSILQSTITGFPTEPKTLLENPIININIPKKPKKEEKKLEIVDLKKSESKPKEKKPLIINIQDVSILEVIIPELIKALGQSKNCSSILDSIESGFGPELTITIPNCPKPQYYTHLYKENYLGEFKTEDEKLTARDNLGVYSKEYIDKIISDIVHDNGDFVTKDYLNEAIQNLDFVNSIVKSYADYQIPEDLFKL